MNNAPDYQENVLPFASGRKPVDPAPDLKGGDGDGTSGGMSDDWKASVDLQLTRLNDAVWKLVLVMIAGAIAPFLAIIGLYVYNGTRFDAVSQKFDAVEARIVGVEKRLSGIEVEQAKIDGKLDLLIDRKAVARPERASR